MLEEIDIREIFCDHLNTLTDYRTKKRNKTGLFIFFGIPVIIGSALSLRYGSIPDNLILIIGTSLSISTGFLLNLFILTYNTVMNAKNASSERTEVRQKFATQIVSNIAFSLMLSMLLVVLVLFFGITQKSISEPFRLILTGFIYSFGIVFGLKILMLMKRTYTLLTGELNRVP